MSTPAPVIITRVRIESRDRRLGRHIHHDSRSLNYKFDTRGLTVQNVTHFRHAPIFDQGDVGSCTGNAGEGCIATDPLYVADPPSGKYAGLDEAAALLLYSDAETIDGDGPYPPNDNGSSGLSIAKALLAAGYISSYQHVFTSADALAAASTYPFIFGTNWYEAMFTPDSDGRVHISGAIAGGHEILCRQIDATNQRVWFDNSWGASWGVAGRFYLTFADFATLLSQDGDVVIMIPAAAPAPPPAPPAPAPVPVPTPTPAPAPTPSPLADATAQISAAETALAAALADISAAAAPAPAPAPAPTPAPAPAPAPSTPPAPVPYHPPQRPSRLARLARPAAASLPPQQRAAPLPRAVPAAAPASVARPAFLRRRHPWPVGFPPAATAPAAPPAAALQAAPQRPQRPPRVPVAVPAAAPVARPAPVPVAAPAPARPAPARLAQPLPQRLRTRLVAQASPAAAAPRSEVVSLYMASRSLPSTNPPPAGMAALKTALRAWIATPERAPAPGQRQDVSRALRRIGATWLSARAPPQQLTIDFRSALRAWIATVNWNTQ